MLLVDVVVVVVVVGVVIVVSDRDRPSEMLAATDQGSWAVCQWRGASGKVILPPISE